MDLIENLSNDHRRCFNQVILPLKQWCQQSEIRDRITIPENFPDLLLQIKEQIIGNLFWKEEVLLFPELEKLGVSVEHGPIGMLLHEHGTIREQVQNLEIFFDKAKKGQAVFLDLLLYQTCQWIQSMEYHSEKEEAVLSIYTSLC